MDPSVKLVLDQGELSSNLVRYRQLSGKLNYLTMTYPDTAIAVSIVSQLLYSFSIPLGCNCTDLEYIKSAPSKGLIMKIREILKLLDILTSTR